LTKGPKMNSGIDNLIVNVDRAEALEKLTTVTNLVSKDFEIDREMSNFVIEMLEADRPAAVVEAALLDNDNDELLYMDILDIEAA
jgi:hypothetical protein